MARAFRRSLWLLAALLVLLAALLGAYHAWIQPGPFLREPLEIVAPEEEGPHRLFVYGTLRSPVVRFLVAGRAESAEPAVLPGFRREGRDLERDRGEAVEGLVLEVTGPELGRYDRYERIGQRYERVEVMLSDGERAWVYRMMLEEDAAVEVR